MRGRKEARAVLALFMSGIGKNRAGVEKISEKFCSIWICKFILQSKNMELNFIGQVVCDGTQIYTELFISVLTFHDQKYISCFSTI